MSRVRIACVGGFLGAGKTTALKAAVHELNRRNLRVGVITNDQGSEIIDTKVMQDLNVPTQEIAGGCFCCKFSDLVEKAEQILDQEHPDIILAEAVGSCTDLSATVYQPLRKYYGHRFDLAPLTILVEPHRINLLEQDGQTNFPDTVQYLFKKQLAEADLILLTKLDTVEPEKCADLKKELGEITGIPVLAVSAFTRAGISEWIDVLLTQEGAGQRILDINYDTYARAEAALGWLNATVEVTGANEFLPNEFAWALIRRFQDGAIAAGMNIAHLKVLAATNTETDRIALTENEAKPQWSGGGHFTPARDVSLTINARIHASPEDLSRLSLECLAAIAKQFQVETELGHIESFSPLPPKPEYRMAQAAP
ncbi:MAG TPA: GTP-binding protein [Pyrinomonadaceae bacterium]|nr:GTP-binding protein [Pyrinomonadaceae bacterium]